MSTELLSSEVDLDIQNEDENHDDDQTLKNMEQEIECPRCYANTNQRTTNSSR